MKTVHLHVQHGARTTTLVFARFPIRIGREAPCECRLAFPFVSRTHAALELHGGRLVLRDVGSSGGTFVHNGAVRLDRDAFIDLENVGWEFQIGRLSIRAALLDDGTQTPEARTATANADGDDDPNGTSKTRAYCPADNATRAYDGEGFDPGVLDQQAAGAELAEILARYKSTRAELEACLRETAAAPDTPGRAEALDALAPRHAELAVRGLQEIASHYVPYAPPLVDATTMESFQLRLGDTLRVLFDGFAALRFVHRADESQRLQSIGTGIDIGARLLDWTSTDDAHGAFEADVVAMMQHHARFTQVVSSGIAKLLAELDPDRIESAGERSWLRAFQYRRFWETYRYRHHRLSTGSTSRTLASTSLVVA